MPLFLIAAVAKNFCIGKDGKLPWHLPEDLAWFKEKTQGKIVLMGRKTWESIPERFRPLPGRTNLVITRQADYPVPSGVQVFCSLEEALDAHRGQEIAVIGGAEIYRQTIGNADTLYITEVDQEAQGDAFFPTIDPIIWKEVERLPQNGFVFVTYRRIS